MALNGQNSMRCLNYDRFSDIYIDPNSQGCDGRPIKYLPAQLRPVGEPLLLPPVRLMKELVESIESDPSTIGLGANAFTYKRGRTEIAVSLFRIQG